MDSFESGLRCKFGTMGLSGGFRGGLSQAMSKLNGATTWQLEDGSEQWIRVRLVANVATNWKMESKAIATNANPSNPAEKAQPKLN